MKTTNTLIEDKFIALGAVSAIVIPGLVLTTWKTKKEADYCARRLTRMKLNPTVFPDQTDNGNWITTADL